MTTHVNKVHHVTTINRVAEDLGVDEEVLSEVANGMEIEDGVTFTDFGSAVSLLAILWSARSSVVTNAMSIAIITATAKSTTAVRWPFRSLLMRSSPLQKQKRLWFPGCRGEIEGPPIEAALHMATNARAAPKTISVFTPAIMMPR
jgi:hypothetical protein